MLRVLLLTLTLAGVSSPAISEIFWPATKTRDIDIKGIGSSGLSGVVYEPLTTQLFYVDDGGKIIKSNLQGYSQSIKKIKGDLESVETKGLGDGIVYVGVEATEKCGIGHFVGLDKCKKTPVVKEVNTSNLTPTGNKWKLDMPTSKKKGMEGLTWVPNGSHPYGYKSFGGVFYASSQDNGTIYVYNLNYSNKVFSSSSPKVSSIYQFKPDNNNNDISDLYFEPEQKILYVLYDTANKIILIDTSTKNYNKIETIALPSGGGGRSDEGLTVLPGCNSGTGTTTVYLSNDSTKNKRKDIQVFNDFPVFCQNNSNDSTFVSHTVPLFMEANKSQKVSFKFKNTGTENWTVGDYHLQAQFLGSNVIITQNSITLKKDILPGKTATFSIMINAPSTDGSHRFQWRMRNGNNSFGEFSPSIRISVNSYHYRIPTPGCGRTRRMPILCEIP